MTRSQLILLGRFTRTNQIAQCLGTLVRNPDRSQIAGSIASRQLLSIAPIGLYSVAGLHRDQRWGDYLALHTELRQLPVEYIASQPGFIADPQLLRWAKLLDELAYRFQGPRSGYLWIVRISGEIDARPNAATALTPVGADLYRVPFSIEKGYQ